MARKTRQEKLESYIDKVGKCQRWREQEQYEQTWRRLVDMYKGKHWPATTATKSDLIAVNLAFSTINVIAPSVAVNYPKIVVQATNPENRDRAAFVEAVANYLWKHHDFRTPFRRTVKDFLIFGHGWVKTGWKFVEQEQQISEDERESMFNSALTELDAFALETPELSNDLPSEEDVAANIPSTVC